MPDKYYANFDIYPKDGVKDYFITKYVDPIENSTAVGFDMYSEPIRTAAIDSAIQNKRLSATDSIILAAVKKSGFVIMLPVYNNITNEVKGIVWATFQSDKIFDNVYGRASTFPNLNVKLYNGDQVRDNGLIYEHNPNLLPDKNYQKWF